MSDKKQGLILESFEMAEAQGISHTAKSSVVRESSYTVTTVEIETDEDAQRFEKEKGTYVTVEMDSVCEITDTDFESIISAVADIIRSLVRLQEHDCVLIVGIGNRDINADSLGPKCIDRIIVTRGLKKTMPELIGEGGFANVCAISSNVFGVTGIESAELVEGISRLISPKLVVIIDALATRSASRLCKTIQISNTSLTPGAGVGNSRKEINSDGIDSEIISIGMPTVMDASSVNFESPEDLVVMPMNINSATDKAAKLIAFSLNKAFHYDMSTEDILKFLY